MSYLMRCEERPVPRRLAGHATRWAVQWRSIKGTVEVWPGDIADPVQVRYNRYSRLGSLLSRNAESERHFIGQEINRRSGTPTLPLAWVGVGS